MIFNCLGTVKDDTVTIPELLVRQVQSSVYMEDSIRSMAAMGVDAIVEIGPGKALSGFVKKTAPEVPVVAVETAADVGRPAPDPGGPDEKGGRINGFYR